jgi:AraC-like DNA-binding protein
MTYLNAADLGLRPGAEAKVADYPPGATFGPRTLRDFELVSQHTGSAIFRCAGDTEYLVPGSLLLARPGMTDTFEWDRDRPTRHAYVHFSMPPRSAPLRRTTGDLLTALFRHLLSRPPGAEADDVLRLLVAQFIAGPPDPEPLPKPLLAVVDFLRTTWAREPLAPVPNARLAHAATVSQTHLARLFRAEFGVGPATALERLRLDRAADRLRRSNLTIGAIAVQCGFADGYHLSRRFRKVYGVPPRDFRAQPDAGTDGLPRLRRLIWPAA